MQRSAILTATLLTALGLTYVGCTQDFNQFESTAGTGGLGGSGASSSSTMSGSGGVGGVGGAGGQGGVGGVGGAGGQGGVGGAGGQGGGGGMPCQNTGDCPADTACRNWSCVQGMCAGDDAPAGTNLPDPTDGDCKDLECDGMGGEVPVNDDADMPPGDGNPCTTAACVAGVPMQVNDPMGDPCPDGVCNGTGMCLECVVNGDCMGLNATCVNNACVACDDGMMNGTETGVDCGGNCGKCDGAACAAAAECESTFCADGFCCEAACTGTCQSCGLTGTEGTCTNVPLGMTDDAPACTGTMACDGAAMCKLANGQTCANGGQCASGKCTGAGANKTCTP